MLTGYEYAVMIFPNMIILLFFGIKKGKATYGFLSERPEFLDLALVYALINFIGTIAVSKYVEFSHMGRPTGGDELGDI